MSVRKRRVRTASPEASPDRAVSVELGSIAATNGDKPLVDDHVFLLGRPSLRQYLSFVSDLAVDGTADDEGLLAKEWRAAHKVIARREIDEAKLAENPPMLPLPRHLVPELKAFEKNPSYASFDLVPSEVLMVELDRLVVYQKHINLEFVRQIRARIGVKPSDEEIFRICLPSKPKHPPVKWMRASSDTFVFLSPSNDIRYLGSLQLKPENIVGSYRPAQAVAIIGLSVGFGSNFLNAIHCENRLVLNNGSHRAYALREAGITHVPCIVQHASNREELRAIASSDLKRNPDVYLRRTRPSMLRDYFDPELRKVIPCTRRLRQVRVKYFTDENDLPAL